MIGLDVGEIESEAFWREFLRSLKRRGQRRTVRFVRDMHRHCRPSQRSLVSAALREVFNAEDQAQARERVTHVIDQLAPTVPKVAELLAEAEEDLLAFYAFPAEHWSKLRSTNPLERLDREIGRRTDVVGIFPDDVSLIRLAGMPCIEQNDCHEGRQRRRRGGLSCPRRALGAVQGNRFDARRQTCSISGSTGAPAARHGARSLTGSGELQEGRISADEDGLARLVARLGPDGYGCIEMMSGAAWVRDRLTESGWGIEIADARKVKGDRAAGLQDRQGRRPAARRSRASRSGPGDLGAVAG